MNKSTVYFSDQQMAEWELLSRQQARPKAEILREAFDRYAAECRAKRPLPPWIGSIDGDDDSLTSANVDEWLEANWHPE